ncbi:MAG: hypothetical protein K0S40_3187 [Actinomycetospora sp.]|nr:hypothetical protein [Actinomycetospora sp.]
MHVAAAAPAAHARRVPGVLERRAGDRGPAGGAGGQLAVPARAAPLGRDPGAAVHAGRRHPSRRAAQPGRAPAGVVRRPVGALGLRPVRGERPLLRRAAAPGRGRGPVRRARRRPAAEPARAAAPQRHGVALEPPGVRRGRRRPAPAAGEPRAARRADGRRRCGQRDVLLRPHPRPRRVRAPALAAHVVRRRRGQLHRRRAPRHRCGPVLAGHRHRAGRRAGVAPDAAAGPPVHDWPGG